MSLMEPDLFGTIDRVAIAIERIKAYTPAEGLYVAFSGGKDSIVLLDLVRRAGVRHDAWYDCTGLDAPEVVQFIRREYPSVSWNMPKKNLWQLIEEKGTPPTRMIRYCCSILKEGGGRGRIVATGVRREESAKRAKRGVVEACAKKNKRFVNAIVDWSDKDVWEYIRSNGLKYPSLYDEGFNRVGCVGCPMSDNRRKEFARWPGFERAYRRAFGKAVEANKQRPNRVLVWENSDAMFDWWMDEKRDKGNPDQGVLFE